MASTDILETEQKYDADASTPLPALPQIPGVERVSDPVTDQLEAVYFDTPSLALASRRITLRRRTGGTDDGWHLKLPGGQDQRTEIHAPLGQPETVPKELLDHLQVYLRGEDLRPVARLSTRRTTRRLYGPGGEHLADFADDGVHAEALHPARPATDWREWEIELIHGTPGLFAAAEDLVTSTGARRSGHASKLARTLGDVGPVESAGGAGRPRKKGPASEVVRAYVDQQISELLTHDPGVRLEEPDAVHRMRSATRRIRSAVATYRKLFTKTPVRTLRDELKWLARILGRPRDAEVMRDRLRQHIRELPQANRAGAVLEPIEHELGTAYDAGYRKVLTTLESGRYYRLLDGLENFRDHPPTTSLAARKARKVTTKMVNKSSKRLDRAHKAVKHAGRGPARDTALHQVRKDAKRLRHGAESAAGIHARAARKLEKSAHRIQKILGDHQDSVMARALLHRLAADPVLPHATALIYRRVQDLEEHIARDTEAGYRKARKKSRGLRLP